MATPGGDSPGPAPIPYSFWHDQLGQARLPADHCPAHRRQGGFPPLLVDQDSGQLRLQWLTTLIEDLLHLRKRGQQVILVSSGAIALGRRELGLALRATAA